MSHKRGENRKHARRKKDKMSRGRHRSQPSYRSNGEIDALFSMMEVATPRPGLPGCGARTESP